MSHKKKTQKIKSCDNITYLGLEVVKLRTQRHGQYFNRILNKNCTSYS